MSARGVMRADPAEGVLWIIYDGRGDELAANLRAYCVDFIPSLYFGRIGITFRPGLPMDALEIFTDAAVAMVDLLTARRGVSEREEREFCTSLVIVQTCQSSEGHDSVQARELASWVRTFKCYRSVGGAA